MMSECSGCKLNYKVGVVRLYLCLVSRLVSNYLSAFLTFMDNDVSALCVGLCLDRAENTAAVVLSVAGIYVNVQRAEAKRAVIS